MFRFIKKMVLKSIINDIKKQIPELKEQVVKYLEEHKDELFEFVKEKIKQAIKDFVDAKINH